MILAAGPSWDQLWVALHGVFGTLWGLFALTVAITVIALFSAAFSNYDQGQGED